MRASLKREAKRRGIESQELDGTFDNGSYILRRRAGPIAIVGGHACLACPMQRTRLSPPLLCRLKQHTVTRDDAAMRVRGIRPIVLRDHGVRGVEHGKVRPRNRSGRRQFRVDRARFRKMHGRDTPVLQGT
jgi:hypothetical protein